MRHVLICWELHYMLIAIWKIYWYNWRHRGWPLTTFHHLWLIWRQFQIVFFLFLLNKNSYFFPFLQGSNIALQLSDQSVIVLVNQGWSDFLITTAEIERISQSRYDEQPLKWAIYCRSSWSIKLVFPRLPKQCPCELNSQFSGNS